MSYGKTDLDEVFCDGARVRTLKQSKRHNDAFSRISFNTLCDALERSQSISEDVLPPTRHVEPICGKGLPNGTFLRRLRATRSSVT